MILVSPVPAESDLPSCFKDPHVPELVYWVAGLRQGKVNARETRRSSCTCWIIGDAVCSLPGPACLPSGAILGSRPPPGHRPVAAKPVPTLLPATVITTYFPP